MKQLSAVALCALSLTAFSSTEKTVYDFSKSDPKIKTFGNVKQEKVPGNISAFTFDGKKGYVEAPSYGNPTAFSGEAWIKVVGKSKDDRGTIMIRRGKGNQWQFWAQSDGLFFFTWNKKAKNHLSATAKVPFKFQHNKWYHVAFETDSNKICRIYIDGKKMYDKAPTMEVDKGSSPVRIGGDEYHTFNGAIGNAKLYDGLLPEGRMKEIQDSLFVKTVYDFNWEKPLKVVKLVGNAKIVNGRDDGKALLLNGGKGYAEAPAYGNPVVFSGEAWIKIQGPSKGNRGIIMIRRGKGNQWQFWVQPDAVYFFTWNHKAKNSLGVTAKAPARLKTGIWYHLAFETDSDKLCRIYINGKKSFDGKPSMPVDPGFSPVRIGGDGTYSFNGLIGETKLYNGLLPEERMKKIKEDLLPAYKKNISDQAAMDFEKEGAWNTAPIELFDMIPAYKLGCSRTQAHKAAQVLAVTPEKLASGAKLSTKHVTSGKHSLLWKDHTTYPTLASHKMPKNWKDKKTLSLDIYSERPTNQIVFVAVLSDSPETKWKDFYYLPIKINWQGAKKVELPLAEFKKYEKVAGWDKVGGVYLFTKMFGCQPNPYTELYLDNMQISDKPATGWNELIAELPQVIGKDNFPVEYTEIEWQKDQLNHRYPETADNKAVYTPYAYQYYFRNERDLFKYYPKFVPGYVCFDQNGKAYVNSGEIIQFKGDDGKWHVSEPGKAIVEWAKKQGYKGIKIAWTHNQSEKVVRFDKDGDAYVLIQIEGLDEKGKVYDWKTRGTLLLHSNDKMKTWQIYKLPSRTGEFEKLDGHNQECLDRPPLILMGDYKYFGAGDPGGYLLLPEKKSDGTLVFPKPIKYSDNCISVTQHSGGGNQALTKDGKIYIIYSWYVPDHRRKGDWKKSCPPIPADHPGLKLKYIRKSHTTKTEYSKDGVPAFVVAYDLKTKKLGKPVYVGSGGGVNDNHNWGAITVDGKGYLHVVVNGHHNPVVYTRTVNPLDISKWTAPEYVLPKGQRDQPNLSYATLNCDKKNNLYTVHRSTTGVYNNHIGLYRRTPEGNWQPEETLIVPFKYMYKVWGNKMMYNPATDRMCLTLYGQSSMKQLTRDQYEFDIFYWPDHEKVYYSNTYNAGLNRGPASPKGGCNMMLSNASEAVSLLSTGPGKDWKLVTSEDLR